MKLLEFWTNGDDHGFREVPSIEAAEEGPVYVEAAEALRARAELRTELTELNGELARMQKERNDARAENERSRARCRTAAQTLISAVGATGPEDVESVAARTVAKLAAANALLAEAADEILLADETDSRRIPGDPPAQNDVADRIRAHLARQPAAPPRCRAHDASLANAAFFKCGCRYVSPPPAEDAGQPAAPDQPRTGAAALLCTWLHQADESGWVRFKAIADETRAWLAAHPVPCPFCSHAPCLQTEDCPGGRHHERIKARGGDVWELCADKPKVAPKCTGIAAGWCPVHGDCSCPRIDTGERSLEDHGCPLHSASSTHAELADDAPPAPPDPFTKVLREFLRDWVDWTSQEMYGETIHDGWEEQDREKLFEHIEALQAELALRESK